jgi:hypothetical protein
MIIWETNMLINEIFNTVVDVKWTEHKTGHVGEFKLDNKQYKIQVDEYEVRLSKLYSIIDFGFTRDGSWELTNDNRTSSGKIFGAIMNSFIPKINKLKPDIIVFGVNNRNGYVDERKSLYSKLASWWCRGTSFRIPIEWEKTPNGQYTVLTKGEIPDSDVEAIKDFIKSIPSKDE